MFTPKGRILVSQHEKWLTPDEINLPLNIKNDIVRQRIRDFDLPLPRQTIFATENVEGEIL